MTARTPAPRRPIRWRLRRAWADAPLVVQGVLIAAAYLAFLTLVGLTAGQGAVTGGALLVRVVGAVAFGAVAVLAQRMRARRLPPGPRWVEVSEAVDDGALPADADADADADATADPLAWRDALERRRRMIRQETGVVPAMLVLGGVLLVLLGSAEGLGWGVRILPAVFVVAAAVLPLRRRARLARVDALLAPLAELAADRRAAADRAAFRIDPPTDEPPLRS